MKHIILYIFIFFIAKSSSAQTLSCEEMENLLIKSYSKILYYADKNEQDSLLIQNDEFFERLKFYTKYFPETLTYPFRKLQDSARISIASSTDSLFRIYSWNTWRGGTWHMYENIYQYINKGKVHALYMILELADSLNKYPQGSLYSDIFSLKNNDTTYYLAISNNTYSNKDCKQRIEISYIEDGNLIDVKIIKAKTGMRNSLSFNYDFFSVVDKPERPLKLITYDNLTQTIIIPIVLADGKVTNKFIHYKFTGEYFEKVNIEKPK